MLSPVSGRESLWTPTFIFTHTPLAGSELQVNRTVYQSSVDLAWEGFPEKAIDGDLRATLVGGFALTLREANPWWAVDLGAIYKITAVVITNRADCCCKYRKWRYFINPIDPNSATSAHVVFPQSGYIRPEKRPFFKKCPHFSIL